MYVDENTKFVSFIMNSEATSSSPAQSSSSPPASAESSFTRPFPRDIMKWTESFYRYPPSGGWF